MPLTPSLVRLFRFPPMQTQHASYLFPNTRWTLLAEVGSSGVHNTGALTALLETYRPPLYDYLRWLGEPHEDAEDILQGFLLSMVQEQFFSKADRKQGRLRSFLQAALSRYIGRWKRHAQRQKRGGGKEHIPLTGLMNDPLSNELVNGISPSTFFDRAWTETLLVHVLTRLRDEETSKNGVARWAALEKFVLMEDAARPDYAAAAAALGLSVATTQVAVSRIRQRYRQLLREEIGATLTEEDSVQEEIDYLLSLYA